MVSHWVDTIIIIACCMILFSLLDPTSKNLPVGTPHHLQLAALKPDILKIFVEQDCIW